MPNHCENDLYVSGKKELLNAMLSEHFEAPMRSMELVPSFKKIVPEPLEAKLIDAEVEAWDAAMDEVRLRTARLEAEGKINALEGAEMRKEVRRALGERPINWFDQGGCEWRTRNWGTKWGAYEPFGMERSERRYKVSFLTAERPPIPVIVALSKLYPKLMFWMKSFERGKGFQVHVAVKGGEITHLLQGEYRGSRGG